jgi:hypothetical protein
MLEPVSATGAVSALVSTYNNLAPNRLSPR